MRDHIRLALLIALTTTLLAPSGTHAQETGPMEDWPDWVKEAMESEVRKVKFRTARMPVDTIGAKMAGKPEPVQAIEDGWYFLSDLKAGSPLECYIYTTALDLASLTNTLAENNIAAVARGAGGEIGVRNIHYTDAGVIDGLPYLALEWIYTVGTGAQTQVGFTKIRAAVKGDIAFACSHNYLGYRETFAKAFSGFIESVEYEIPTPAPYYEEISLLDYRGSGNGVIYVSFTEDEDGDIKIASTEASLIPVDASTLMTSDGITISYATPDGELINSISVAVQNGEIVSNLSLQRNDTGAWVSGGILQGKEIETELDGAIAPASELRLLTTARELFAGSETSVTLDMWVPAADPTRFLQSTLTRDDAEVAGQGKITLGPISYLGHFDENGNMTDAVVSIGPMTIDAERIWSAGNLVK